MNHFNLLIMKHFLKSTTTLLTFSALFACSEDVAMEDSLSLNNGKTLERINITGQDFQTEGGTRSTVNINNEGVQFLWSANDTVGIFPNTGFQAPFAMDEGAGMQTATFNGGGWALKASSTYAAYYPFNFYNRDMTKIPVSYSGQAQEGNNSTAHIGSYDFMAASVTTPSNGAVTFDLKHMGCLMMLQTDLDETKTLTKVSLKSEALGASFTTAGTIDLTAVVPQITATSTSNTLEIPLKNFTVATNETSTIYLMLAPVNLTDENLEITLFDEDGAYIQFNVAGKNFVAGTAYTYQLTEGKRFGSALPAYAVDLGLPSGTLWADRNVGAATPKSYGEYFAWGETESKTYYFWDSYKWSVRNTSMLTKYCTDSSFGTDDDKTTLDLEDDAAYVNMGAEWRMPTYAELQELYDNCIWLWTTLNGVKGHKLTSKNNGNSLFIPAAGSWGRGELSGAGASGCYWSSSVRRYSFGAYSHIFTSSNWEWSGGSNNNRSYGYSVRAVVRK